jgi:chemotaxis regulatin CheY-phosphate phosphatase CheZ
MTMEQDATPVASLPNILMRTSQEITAVLNSLDRSHTLLEHAAVPRLQRTHAKLQEVTQATESATHDMLDKLDRTGALIDEIGARIKVGIPAGDESAQQLHEELRDETHRLVMCLQFQDLVAQQIAFATQVLRETERRMTQLADQFKSTVFGQMKDALAESAWTLPHDPEATDACMSERQALADIVFGDSLGAS